VDHTTPLAPIPLTATTPWRHQLEAYHFAMQRQGVAMLAMDVGTGKTKVAVDVVSNLEQCQRVLILAPKSVIEDDTWRTQFSRHAGVPWKVINLNAGSVVKRAAYLAEMDVHTDGRLAVVINYEAAIRMDAMLTDTRWDCVIVDESHKIASAKTQINQLCCALPGRYRLALTGTPFKQSPADIFGQFLFLDRGIFGPSQYRFEQRYAKFGGFEQRSIVGIRPEMEKEFMDRFARVAYMVKRDDVLDLPPERDIEIHVNLSDTARAIYDRLDDEFFAELEMDNAAHRVNPVNAAVRLLRLQQITGGDLVDDDQQHIGIDLAKQRALEELLDEMDLREPVVVFARFSYDLKAIMHAATSLKRRYAELSGRVHDLQRWKRGEADVLGVQIQSGGAGIDLTRARYCVYYSLGHSLTDYVQSRARIHRPGQNRSTTYYHLIAADTVDEHVYRALALRQEVINHLETLHPMKHTLVS
jgi:SNF2 family DNA or RNA helicase